MVLKLFFKCNYSGGPPSNYFTKMSSSYKLAQHADFIHKNGGMMIASP